MQRREKEALMFISTGTVLDNDVMISQCFAQWTWHNILNAFVHATIRFQILYYDRTITGIHNTYKHIT